MPSIFLTKIVAIIFDFNGIRLGREKFVLRGGGGGSQQLKIRRGVGVGEWRVLTSSHSSPTIHSNSKSNMAGQINDHELIMLAHHNKTPALQANTTPTDLAQVSVTEYRKVYKRINILQSQVRKGSFWTTWTMHVFSRGLQPNSWRWDTHFQWWM